MVSSVCFSHEFVVHLLDECATLREENRKLRGYVEDVHFSFNEALEEQQKLDERRLSTEMEFLYQENECLKLQILSCEDDRKRDQVDDQKIFEEMEFLCEQNETLKGKVEKLEAESATWNNNPANFMEQYHLNECANVLSELNEEDQETLKWTLQNNFDIYKNGEILSFTKSYTLREACLKKRQFKESKRVVDKYFRNIKKVQLQGILKLKCS